MAEDWSLETVTIIPIYILEIKYGGDEVLNELK